MRSDLPELLSLAQHIQVGRDACTLKQGNPENMPQLTARRVTPKLA